MRILVFVLAGWCAAMMLVFVGMFLAAVGVAHKSVDLWLVKRKDGSQQFFLRAEDVAACLEVDGYCSVEKMRVLP